MWKQGTEGLAITALLALVLANTLDLTAIASLASITMLLVYFLVNLGHLRLTHETGASRFVILLAVLTGLAILLLFIYHVVSTAPMTALALVGLIGAAFNGEILLQKLRNRKIRPRCQ